MCICFCETIRKIKAGILATVKFFFAGDLSNHKRKLLAHQIILILGLYFLVKVTNKYVFPEILNPIMKSEFVLILFTLLTVTYLAFTLAFPNFSSSPQFAIYVSPVLLPAVLLLFIDYLIPSLNWSHANKIIGLCIILLLIFILLLTYQRMLRKKSFEVNFRITQILWIMAVALVLGILIVHSLAFIEKHTVGFTLNEGSDGKTRINLNLECDNPAYIGKTINCELSQVPYHIAEIPINIEGFWRFTHNNLSQSYQNFSDNIYMSPPPEVGHVYVEIRGEIDGEPIWYSSALSQEPFPTYEQYRENKRQFALFLFPFLAFLLAYTPQIMAGYRELFKRDP